MDIKPGQYRHYKGKLYELIGVARHSETLQEMVVYKGLYKSDKFGDYPLWVRPRSEFEQEVDVEGKKEPRFKFVG